MMNLEAEADVNRCGALRDFWYVACLAGELRNKPLGRTIMGVPLVLFRDEQGTARALRDRCLHRNAALSEGVVIGGQLACPYHGWMYNGAGECVHVPSLGPSQRGAVLNPEGHTRAGLKLCPADVGRVERFETLDQDGLVFVFMGQDVARAIRPAFRTPFYDDKRWSHYYMVTRFPNGVTNLVENFMDVPHTVFVHAGWFRRPAQKQVPARVERKDGSVLVTYQQEKDEITGLGRLLNPWGEPMVHTDKFYIPNVTRVDYAFGSTSGFVITSQCTPVSATESLVFTAIGYRLPVDVPRLLVSRALKPLIGWYTRQVIQQDVDIMGVQRKGMLRGQGGGTFVSTEADLLHADIEAYRSWLLQGAQGSGPADEDRNISFWI